MNQFRIEEPGSVHSTVLMGELWCMGDSLNVRAVPGQGISPRLAELLRELEDAVILARAAPGQRYGFAEFVRLGRARLPDLEQVLPELVARGLVTVDGDAVVIKPLDKDAMFASVARRKALEIAIVRAAAVKATDAQLQTMKASEALQQRCALIGDIDGLMAAERQLEEVLVTASGLTAEGAELKAIKVEFRRAWCAVHRLRNFTHVANIRTALVAAIVARDADGAQDQVNVFFEHLLRTY